MPAEAGIQGDERLPWTPAFAGVTMERELEFNKG